MTTTWMNDWTPDAAPKIAFNWMPHDEGRWTQYAPGLERRDLGLAAASFGRTAAFEIRSDGTTPPNEWYSVGSDVRFLFVLAGSCVLALPDREETLATMSSATLTRGSSYSLREFSPDFKALDFRSPDAPDRPIAQPEGWDGTVTHEDIEKYEGGGLRSYFIYRDLETAGPTGGRIHVKVIRANIQTGGGTGPHTHTMAQCFYVLGGSATLRVEGHGDTPVTPGDAMCFGDGVDHDVTEYSSDYVVLVWCTPAEFDTTPTR